MISGDGDNGSGTVFGKAAQGFVKQFDRFVGWIEAVKDISCKQDEIHLLLICDLADFVQYQFLLFQSGEFLKPLAEVPVGSMEEFDHFSLMFSVSVGSRSGKS